MREILFKAKRKVDRKWVEGDYFQDAVRQQHFIRRRENIENRFTTGDYEIMPETLCQYTGMNDENGNKIFENDIVIYDGGLAKIEWNNSCRAFLVVILYMGYWVEEDLGKIKGCNLKVIRNIFDNSDLPKSKE